MTMMSMCFSWGGRVLVVVDGIFGGFVVGISFGVWAVERGKGVKLMYVVAASRIGWRERSRGGILHALYSVGGGSIV